MRDNASSTSAQDVWPSYLKASLVSMTPQSSENEIAECDVIMQVGHTKKIVRTTFSRRGAAILVVRDDVG